MVWTGAFLGCAEPPAPLLHGHLSDARIGGSKGIHPWQFSFSFSLYLRHGHNSLHQFRETVPYRVVETQTAGRISYSGSGDI